MTRSRNIEKYPSEYMSLMIAASEALEPLRVPCATKNDAISLRHTLYSMRSALTLWIKEQERNWKSLTKNLQSATPLVEQLKFRKDQLASIDQLSIRIEPPVVAGAHYTLEIYKTIDGVPLTISETLRNFIASNELYGPFAKELKSLYGDEPIEETPVSFGKVPQTNEFNEPNPDYVMTPAEMRKMMEKQHGPIPD